MLPQLLQLNGVTRIERHDMISRAKEAILDSGGNILDFHMFSNVSVCINFEISVGKLERLRSSLAATGLKLYRESGDLLEDCCVELKKLGESSKATDISATLQIAFIHNEPDLRIEIPPIPG